MQTDIKDKSKFTKALIFLFKLSIFLLAEYCIEVQPPFLHKSQTFQHLAQAVAFYFAIDCILFLSQQFIISIYVKRHNILNRSKNNFILGIKRIASMLNIVALLIAIMLFIRINPLNFITSISIVAAAIALLSKDYITNMINGLIIMFSDRISLGDHIIVGAVKGKIIDINFINIVVEDEDNDIVFIPNTTVLNTNVINQSKIAGKKITFEFKIANTCGIDFDTLNSMIRKELNQFSEWIQEASILLKPTSLDKDQTAYHLHLIILRAYSKKEKEVKKSIQAYIINLAISSNLAFLEKQGFHPQR